MADPKSLSKFALECYSEGLTTLRADHDISSDQLEAMFEDLFCTPLLPQRGETVAFTFDQRKTAALFFDRVWRLPLEDSVPDDIAVYGATDVEIYPNIIHKMLHINEPEKLHREMKIMVKHIESMDFPKKSPHAPFTLVEAFRKSHNVRGTPLYNDTTALDGDYRAGDARSLLASIEGLKIVDEDALSWDQVRELRSDEASKVKLRRFRKWLDAEFDGTSLAQVEDEIAVRLEDYEWALKKHGIESVAGAVSDLLDFRFLPAASATTLTAALAGGGPWAALAAGGVVLGKLTVSITQRMVALEGARRGAGAEIAFVHDLKRATKRKK